MNGGETAVTNPRDKQTTTICIVIPKKLAEAIDLLTKELNYPSRSDLIRDAIRKFIREKTGKNTEELQNPPKKSKIIKQVYEIKLDK